MAMLMTTVLRGLRPALGCSALRTGGPLATFHRYLQGTAVRPSSEATLAPRDENKQRRIQLAAAYRALDLNGLSEGTCNHLTALTPAADGSGRELLLLVPAGTHWSQVTPTCLLGLDENNEVVEGDGDPEISAMCIHRGVRTNHKHLAVMHTHSPYVTALGLLEDPTLLMAHQNSMRFYEDLAYDKGFPGHGITEVEGRRLAAALGDKRLMFMCGHGVLTAAPSVALAFDMAYYIERCAMFQMLAMATGKPLAIIEEEIVKDSQRYLLQEEHVYATRHLEAHIRGLATNSAHFQGYRFENPKHSWTE